MSISGVNSNLGNNYQPKISKRANSTSTQSASIESKEEWGTPLSSKADDKGVFRLIYESIAQMVNKPTIMLGDNYSPIVESYVNGLSSHERSLNDKKCTFTDYGYDCYIGEDGEPYMRYEDEKRLYEECQQNGMNFMKIQQEILGKLRYLSDGSTMFISDNHYDGGLNKGRAIHIGKNFKTISIPIKDMSCQNIFEQLASNYPKTNYMDESLWQRLLS